MHRKAFLNQTFLLAALFPFRKVFSQPPAHTFMTVTGPVDASSLGYILPHEHVMVDFIGAEKVSKDRYRADAVIAAMLPLLQDAKAAGCSAFFDCTPAYLGRDVAVLKQLSEQCGLPIITNTGYYSAVQHKHLPEHAFTETARQLANRWIGEAEKGIEGTGVRPGFIKISVDKDPLDPVNRKIVEAAALTHKATGLTIGSHTGNGKAAIEQLDILEAQGVAAKAFVWIHAQSEKDRGIHREAAERGAWIEFDNLGWEPVPVFLEHIRWMEQNGFLKQLLISHDAGWYDVEQQGRNTVKPFTPLFRELIPAMNKEGWSQEQIRTLFHQNPVNAYSIGRRLIQK